VLTDEGRYDAATRRFTLDIAQESPPSAGQPHKLPLHIPLAIGLVAADGRDIALRLEGESGAGATTRLVELREARQRFTFVDVPSPPVPSLARGYSAPVRIIYPYDDAGLALLAAHDSDPVNRWDAAQRSFSNAILALAADHNAGRALALPDALSALFAHLIGDAGGDPSLVSLAITLPDVATIANLQPTIDVDGVSAARAFLARALAGAHRESLDALYARLAPTVPYAPVQAQIGPRRLRSAVLGYLCASDDTASRKLAVAQFDDADNMTDVIGALRALRDTDSLDRDHLFTRFEARWQAEPLVLDKWFSLEASSDRPGALARVRSLLAHPRFNAHNPNRVRALVGTFALRNFTRFHAADGSGYAFVADRIMAIDPVNPMVASRIAGAFELWKRFPQPRRGLMQAELQRLSSVPSLSGDVGEIVARSLAS
jgi:aminopeptidase N